MAKRGPKKGHGGRPKAEIDWKVFETACKLMATKEDIFNLLEVSESTLERKVKEKYNRTFETVLKSLSEGTKISLRRNQIRLSEKNAAMAIWLGKQYLGQVDKQELDHKNNGNSFGRPSINFIKKNNDNN